MVRKFQKLDSLILIILLIFSVICVLTLHSATLNASSEFANSANKMAIFYALGLVAMLIVSFFDYKWILKLSPLIYLISTGLLAFVLISNKKINNSSGWISLPGGLSFQPAEFAKLAVVLILVAYLQKMNPADHHLRFFKHIIPLGLLTGVPFAFILMQPDLGNALALIVILVAVYWVANIRFLHFLIGFVITGVVIAGTYYWYDRNHDEIKAYLDQKQKGHWVQRIDAMFFPSKASKDDLYHVRNATIAIGSGQFLGEGYTKGDSVQNHFVPYPYADSVFAVIGEEFGFAGSSLLIFLFFLLIYRLMIIAIECFHSSGSYIAVGLIAMLIFQIFENIGMLVGMMPLTGITLPFISYGGTSLLINMLSMGLIISIRIHNVDPNPGLTFASTDKSKSM
ncbi:FtsW/RodA/SpoVE family cell cycle protein [Paenibacillus larvae]